MSFFARSPDLEWLSISFDRSLALEDAQRFMVSVLSSGDLRTVAIEVERRGASVGFRIGSSQPRRIRTMLETFLPNVTVQPATRHFGSEGSAWAVRCSTRRRGLAVSDPEAITKALLGSLAVSGSVHQLVIGRRLRPVAIRSDVSGLRFETWPKAIVEAAAVGSQRHDSELRRAMAVKQSEAGAEVCMRLLVPGKRNHAHSAITAYTAAVRSLEAPGLRLRVVSDSWGKAVMARMSGKRLALNASELTALAAWPFGEATYPGIDRSGSRLLPVSSESKQRVIGRGVHPSTRVDVGLSATDGLRHLWALGPTGVGKSTLLENLALQDIEHGRGVVVIDPKGDLVDGILSRVNSCELERVVLLDPARRDQVVGFNPLAVPSHEAELAVDGVLHVLRSLNANSWGPRTQDILHAALLTLSGSSQPTLVAIPQLLTDSRFRRKMISSGISPVLRSFWTWYEALSDGERSSVIAPVLNKIRPFTMRSSLRAMLGQSSPKFDMRTVFTQRRVLLVPLRTGELGSETANLLGSLIVARLWQLTQARSATPIERRHPVFAYLDEFQEYLRLPTDFTGVLTQARGLGLGLVLAHQHLAQLSPDVRAAVSANAQSSVVFRLGADDANHVARPLTELEAVDFTQLRAYSAYSRLLIVGQTSGFGSIKTMPPRAEERSSTTVASRLSKQWGVTPNTVDEALFGQPPDGDPDAPIGSKKRGLS